MDELPEEDLLRLEREEGELEALGPDASVAERADAIVVAAGEAQPQRYTLFRIASAVPPAIRSFSASGTSSDSIDDTARSMLPSLWG